MNTWYQDAPNPAMPCRIVFFGTPEFAVPTLEALISAGYEVVAVVTQPDKPVGRGLKMEAPAVKVRAQELGLTILQPETLRYAEARPPELRRPGLGPLQQPKDFSAVVAVCVAYGKIVPKEILETFPRGILNIHPSLLPKYRGPSPIQAAILNGDSETGVTIIRLDEEMDHGPIIASSVQRLASSTTGDELSKALAQEGANLLIKTLPQWLNGRITPQLQDHTKATYTKILERADGKIDWRKSAEYIERMVRAYDFWPGTWTMWSDKRLKVLRVSLLHPTIGCASNATPGHVWKTENDRLAVNCNPGSIILEQLQLEGKKALSGREFLRGYLMLAGSTL